MISPSRLRTALVLALVFLASTAYAEIKVGGFTDLSFFATDAANAAPSSGFREGQFVLHLSAALAERASVFAEISWSPGNTGFGTEVERAIFTYRHSDAFKPSAGRYHTPVSWWNVAFHHGTWLQTSVDRPIPVRFGSNFLPIHFVGAMLDGRLFPGGLSVSYSAGVGNGRADTVSRAGDAGDANNHRAMLLHLGFRHDALYDLQFGGAVYIDRFPIHEGMDIDEQIYSGYVVFSRETPEVLAEYFLVRHDDDFTGMTTDNTSYYVQVAYRLPWFHAVLKPYGRYENMDIDENDRGFNQPPSMDMDDHHAGVVVEDLQRILFGIRYDFMAVAALKFEARRYKYDDGDDVNEVYTALNVAF